MKKDKLPARAQTDATLARGAPAWLLRNVALLLVITGVGAGFVVLLQAGFWFNHQTAPAEITSVFPYAVVMLVVIVGVIASGNWPKAAGVQQSFLQDLRPQGSNAAFAKAERERLAKLAADPVLRKYVALIERDEYWSDARIAYAEDHGCVATCMHLQPVERAMRGAGLDVRLQNGVNVQAACRINRAAFDSVFGAPVAALYGEWRDTDRHSDGPYVASFWCRLCGSNIFVIHPQEAQPETPLFPPQV